MSRMAVLELGHSERWTGIAMSRNISAMHLYKLCTLYTPPGMHTAETQSQGELGPFKKL